MKNLWNCAVIITEYDNDWSFYNKENKIFVKEGSYLNFYGETAIEALKKFTDNYSVEGWYREFGEVVPEWYRHVEYVRGEIKKFISEIEKDKTSEEKSFRLSGNWDVDILLFSRQV